jgi:ERF superfamily
MATSNNIFELITEVKRKAGALGKEQTSGVPFPFRGIDGTINHLAKHVEDAGIVIVPSVVSHVVTERSPDGKRVVKTSQVETDFTFYAPDGSHFTARTAGLADDFADRSTSQAQSVALRIALLQTFFLPTQSPEPEQTGQSVQDGLAQAPKPSATERKLERAASTPPPASAAANVTNEPASKKEVRTEWIDKKKIGKQEVIDYYNKVKAAGNLDVTAAYDKVLADLKSGELKPKS